MITDPIFYAVAIPALMLVGISKGGFGSGIGIVAAPAISLVVPPLTAIGIMLPLLCLMDLFGVWSYRRSWSRPMMLYLLPGAILGIGVATLTAGLVDEHMIRVLVGLIAVLFAVNHWLQRWCGGGRVVEPRAENRIRGLLWAAASGFTSFVGHAGGPPLQVYLLPLRLDKTMFVGTTVIFFMIVNYAKLVPYAWLGMLNQTNLMTALVLAPVAPIAMWSGIWLHDKVPEKPFYALCYAFVFVVGLKLLFDGVSGWLG
ncbi:MAG: sulfite exporter TauE/SafE family protein [Minwuia sp.]|nr:sulfite exporter TauE/SafE family protein [Minwuia sp.]